MIKNLFLLLLFLGPIMVFGQVKPLELDEVVVSDLYLKKSRKSLVQKDLKDSIQNNQNTSITSVLQNSAPVYIKENGRGMIASIALRGTTASQTAVVWNGININSQLTGQTDLNTINPQLFDQFSLNLGGGSTLYNSGAMGGSIHLDNTLVFKPLFKNTFQFSAGSFNTFNALIGSKYATEKFAISIKYSHQKSYNNYEFIGFPYRNSNGEYHLNQGNLSFAYKINDENVVKLFSNIYIGNRNLSPSIAAVSNAKYLDKNYRNLASWTFSKNKFQSDLKYAFLREEYQYFQDKSFDKFTYGNVNQQLIKLDLKYNFTNQLELASIFTYQNVKGNGSDIQAVTRNILDYGILLNYQYNDFSGIEFQVKKEKSNDFESPILFSLGNYNKINSFYTLKTQISTNYRMPTFNDMYWSSGGNINLKPENSKQLAVSNQLSFNKIKFNINAYYYNIKDMIQWLPNSNGLWQPINNESVISKGIELDFNYDFKIKKHNLRYNLQYAYTSSISRITQLQLFYVPILKLTSVINYQYKFLKASLLGSYNGKVFTTIDHSSFLKPYVLLNSNIHFTIKNVKLGLNIENLTNQFYQNVVNRPLPGRNYNLLIQYNL